jgi:hypothetical protein
MSFLLLLIVEPDAGEMETSMIVVGVLVSVAVFELLADPMTARIMRTIMAPMITFFVIVLMSIITYGGRRPPPPIRKVLAT